MNLERIVNSGKIILGSSLLVAALAIGPLLSGCGKNDNDQKSYSMEETQALGISEELQQQWPIWGLWI